MRLKPGWGYWDCTDYPVGGKFCRAPKEGLEVTDVQIGDYGKGCTRMGKSGDIKLAFQINAIQE